MVVHSIVTTALRGSVERGVTARDLAFDGLAASLPRSTAVKLLTSDV